MSNPQEASRSNIFDGAGLNGPTVTIGGTLPGSANFIAGNGTNVDINDLTEGGAAKDSTVQGNFIGTNAGVTAGIASQGYGVSIVHNVTDMMIGGTTPAARNIISGNLAGVYVYDNSFKLPQHTRLHHSQRSGCGWNWISESDYRKQLLLLRGALR